MDVVVWSCLCGGYASTSRFNEHDHDHANVPREDAHTAHAQQRTVKMFKLVRSYFMLNISERASPHASRVVQSGVHVGEAAPMAARPQTRIAHRLVPSHCTPRS